MRENKTLEFIWKGIGFGAKDGLLMHVLNGTYYLPGFLDIDEPYPESRCFSIPLTLKDLESW